jgi:hypothetical protein
MHEVRQGFTQANFNERCAPILGLDLVMVCGATWYLTDSWAYALVAFVALAVVLQIPIVQKLVTFVLSAMWALIAYVVASLFQASDTSFLVAGVAGVMALGLHIHALQYSNDLDGVEKYIER